MESSILEGLGFEDLGLDEAALQSARSKGFTTPSPIQILAIPRLLQGDANLIARARTGTGKTAAFGFPLVQKLREAKSAPRALVLTPTRELAIQVSKEIASLASGQYPRITCIYGGQSMREQLSALKGGVEIVVGTPGRVMDHLKRGSLKLESLDYFILDEADEMLDMGFIEDIETIFARANPESRVLLFSATMPPGILKIASAFMGDYEILEEEASPEDPILTTQRYWIVRESEKTEALVRLIDISEDFYGLVFTQTKVDADELYHALEERGYAAAALHGDIAQSLREKILSRFRSGKTRILVATDVAARGIDVEGLSHVVNYDLPVDTQTYIHRIGRTGRAGAKGEAFTLALYQEKRKLESLLQAVKKISQGIIEKGTVPTVEEVMKAKHGRLKIRLHGIFEKNTASCPETGFFSEIAAELVASYGAENALVRALTEAFGTELDVSRYGKVTTMDERSSSSTSGNGRRAARVGAGRRSGETGATEADGSHLRLYVGLGKDAGYSPRDLAEYFSGLLHIKSRAVTNIMVSERFSLVTLPYQSGLTALQKARADRSLPHMHLDMPPPKKTYGKRKPQ